MDLTNKVTKHISGDTISPIKRFYGFDKGPKEYYICNVIKESGEILEEFVFPVNTLHLLIVNKELTIEGECYE